MLSSGSKYISNYFAVSYNYRGDTNLECKKSNINNYGIELFTTEIILFKTY